ncbi:MAG: patatin-like phospholipase family protein [Candidatus Nanopelagicales bacterium]
MARIALVLGGGGLTGTAFHAGVLTALDRHGWDARTADVIVGTSAGSTATALLRAGFPPGDYVHRMTGEPVSAEAARVLDRIGRVPTPPKRRAGRRAPASPGLLRAIARRPWDFPLGVVAAAALPAGTVDIDEVNPGFGPLFTRWPRRPTWITAVALRTGRRVVFGRDAVATIPEAVSASCAIPGYFRPVTIGGDQYVDGGAHSVHHADLVAQRAYDLVIVSAPLSTTDLVAPELGNVPRAPLKRQLDRELGTVHRSGTPTLVFAPDRRLRSLMGLNSMDLAKRPVVAEATEIMAGRLLSRCNVKIPPTG